MGLSIGKLRVALLVGGGLLVVVVLGFIGYAHYAASRFVKNLPGKLGINITQETDNFTYSQSMADKTVFTIHAAKSIQHGNGKMTLRNVAITLYGQEGDRTDHIYGDHFEYDQNTGNVAAEGEVRIDLESPAGNGHPSKPGASGSVVHINTSGLTFQQKQGFATTDQRVDFSAGAMTGNAIGAQYNSKTGVIVLDSAVYASRMVKDRPAVLTAAHAVLDRQGNQSTFEMAKYVSPGQGMTTDHAVVHTDDDWNPKAMEAQGHCILTGNGQGQVLSERLDVVLNDKGKAKTSHLYGGVRYVDEVNGRGSHGTAQDAQLTFDDAGQISRADLTGSVTGEERGPTATRTMSANRLLLSFKAVPGGHSVLQDADGTGNAQVHEVALVVPKPNSNSKPDPATERSVNTRSQPGTPQVTNTDLSGDTLQAHFIEVANKTGHPGHPVAQISTLHGVGHTVLHQLGGEKIDQTSKGNLLDMNFRPVPPGKQEAKARPSGVKASGSKSSSQPVEVARAVQRGDVTILRIVPPKQATGPAGKSAKAPEPKVQHGSGDVETYDGDTDVTTLQGHAQLWEPGESVAAEQVAMERVSGDATAEGNVRTTYVQAAKPVPAGSSDPVPTPPEPVHVLSDRAIFKHAIQIAFFYATPGKIARMWQGTSQVEAPILEFLKTPERLVARSTGDGDGAMVHGVLVEVPAAKPATSDSAKPDTTKAAQNKPPGKPTVVHIASREMVYTDALRQVELTGKVRVQDVDGVTTANHAIVYLLPTGTKPASSGAGGTAAKPKPPAPAGGVNVMSGQVDRIVANGNVQVDQPGKRANGELLVYTAVDRTFVMTGTKAAPPNIWSDGRNGGAPGTVVGSSLRFHSGDDSVVVTGGDGKSGPQRVRTDTKVKQ